VPITGLFFTTVKPLEFLFSGGGFDAVFVWRRCALLFVKTGLPIVAQLRRKKFTRFYGWSE